MSRYEVLSLLIAVMAAIISLVSLRRTRKTEIRQLELQETQARLASFQHKVLTAEQEAARQADLRVELIRSGRNSQFVFSNLGPAPVMNVNFGFLNSNPRRTPLTIPDQFAQVFPIAEFLPGASHKLAAVLTLQTPSVLEGDYTWTDLDGQSRSRRCKVVL